VPGPGHSYHVDLQAAQPEHETLPGACALHTTLCATRRSQSSQGSNCCEQLLWLVSGRIAGASILVALGTEWVLVLFSLSIPHFLSFSRRLP
jgi:hypothetical protein